ncbi:hypothetical protein WDW89_10685 [Deltaproteobacteria bacterium TL4]
MTYEPHVKQQIRYQVETSLDEVYRLQNDALQVASDYIRQMVVWQYQRFNRLDAKRSHHRHQRKEILTHWKGVADRTFDGLTKHAPFSKSLASLKPALDLPFKGIDFIEHQIDVKVYGRVDNYLNWNSQLVDKLINEAFRRMELQQKQWRGKIKDELATRFPISEEEHLALARDITNLIKRIEVDHQDYHYPDA